MNDMKDNRKYRRYKVDGVEINGKLAFANEVIIRDLSLGGTAVKTDRRLNIGEEYLLKLQNSGSNIPIKGVVVWSLLSGSKPDDKGNIIPIYSAGLKFREDSDKKIKKLIALLDEHEQEHYEAIDGRPGEFVNLSEQFKEALELFAD
jgi:Tfp pilus assembly protein PilZ